MEGEDGRKSARKQKDAKAQLEARFSKPKENAPVRAPFRVDESTRRHLTEVHAHPCKNCNDGCGKGGKGDARSGRWLVCEGTWMASKPWPKRFNRVAAPSATSVWAATMFVAIGPPNKRDPASPGRNYELAKVRYVATVRARPLHGMAGFLRRQVVNVTSDCRKRGPMTERLSPREIECVLLAGQRLGDKEIAEQLGIAPKTVANNLHRAYAKLGVSDRRLAAQRLSDLYPGLAMPIPSDLTPAPIPPVSSGGPTGRGDVNVRPGPVDWRVPPRETELRVWLILGSAVLCVLILTALFTIANVVNGLRG